MLHLPLLVVLGGVLRSHGHKTWVAWTITGVFCVIVFAIRLYLRRSRR